MRVFFLASWWPTRVHPTHGNFVQKHARLVARGHDLAVLAVQEEYHLPSGKRELVVNRQAGYLEVLVYYGRAMNSSKLRNLTNRMRAYCAGFRYLRREWGRPDLVHSHVFLDAGIIGALVSGWWRCPLVVSEHSSRYASSAPLGRVREGLIRWAAGRAEAILPVSEALWSSMESHGITGQYTVVPNVVDSTLFTPARKLSSVYAETFRFLHVSNFDARYKNLAGLLRAFALLCRNCTDIELQVAGDGDLGEVQKLSSTAGVPRDRIHFSGPHSEMEVAKLMQQADGFVLFSRYETQGVVLLEALACGLPVVATRVGGVPEIIEDGRDGYLVKSEDEQGLALAMENLRDHRSDFHTAALRDRTVARCSEAVVREQLDAIYARVLTTDR